MSFADGDIPSFQIFIMSLYTAIIPRNKVVPNTSSNGNCCHFKIVLVFDLDITNKIGEASEIMFTTNSLNGWCNDCLYSDFVCIQVYNIFPDCYVLVLLLLFWEKFSRTFPKFQTCLTFSKHTGVHLVILGHA